MNVETLVSDLETNLMYLLWWAEYDGSGCKLLRVYQKEAEALADRRMIDFAGAHGEVRVDAVQFVPKSVR